MPNPMSLQISCWPNLRKIPVFCEISIKHDSLTMEIGATGPLMGDLMSVIFGRVEMVRLDETRIEIEMKKKSLQRISFCHHS